MIFSTLVSVALFFVLLGGLALGARLGRRLNRTGESAGTAAADGVVFAVLGLLIAFTLSASASRFDQRRQLVVEQANALGTAGLRLDVLGEADRVRIRQRMVEWVDLALASHHVMPDDDRFDAAIARADRLQSDIWRDTFEAVQQLDQPALYAFVMSPLNDWIDLTTTRVSINDMGLPPLVLPTLIVLSITGSLLAGFAMSKRAGSTLLHRLAFAFAISFSIYVIQDLNHPREGLISVESMDKTFRQLRESLAPATQP